jgi:hypothetical protein
MSTAVDCALSPIQIYVDLSRPDGRVIQVGYVAELVTPEYRIMGLVGRENLTSGEINALHGLLHHRASRLWDFLASEFELASGVEPGKGLEYLAARHSFAFSFEHPHPVRLPKSVTDAAHSGNKEKLVEEFHSFLLDTARKNLVHHDHAGIRTKIAA